MNIELDTHTHTISSGHAYSSLNEMALSAKENGLKIMATSDHGPAMPGGAHIYFFHNLRCLPKIIHGVRILKGVEANIVDYTGKLDLHPEVLSELEFVIASFHGPCIETLNFNQTTNALLNILDNKNVNVLGHPEDSRFSFDYKSVIKKAKETNTLIEVNNSSLLPTTFREGCREGLIKILEVCAEEEVNIVLGSDAHHTSSVGRFDMALGLINEIHFPENLIINRSATNFMDFIKKDKKWLS